MTWKRYITAPLSEVTADEVSVGLRLLTTCKLAGDCADGVLMTGPGASADPDLLHAAASVASATAAMIV
jgi:hypothetical protein